ncbi:hypothetical protein [Actinomadura geliboluensis]|uniref:Uncharacterized protein n=1 Tax=Actinomadura geliboluensis TaxID=882440 RepID=A0A5S4HGW9_9ACTN|nr:hypothetical protein [Actinomadura geliboluensis]TMR38220.1 hypothetical protein ETD96_16745 [Actinomadura geliboluensis]
MTGNATDPTSGLISRRRYDHSTAPGDEGNSITFAEDAAAKRADLAGDQPPTVDRQVVLTPLQALIAASFLDEYAARLQHESDRGALTGDTTDYIALVGEVAEHLQRLAGAR